MSLSLPRLVGIQPRSAEHLGLCSGPVAGLGCLLTLQHRPGQNRGLGHLVNFFLGDTNSDLRTYPPPQPPCKHSSVGFFDPDIFSQTRVLIAPPSPTPHELDYLKHLCRDVSSLIEAISQDCSCVLFFCQYLVN